MNGGKVKENRKVDGEVNKNLMALHVTLKV
jgi:hypothetical protein